MHDDPGSIASEKTDIEPELREKLDAFREHVKMNRLVKFWNTTEELPGLVALSLLKTIKTHPAVGWVRGDTANNPDLLNDLNHLRKENERLREQLDELKSQLPPEDLDLASLDESFAFKLTYRTNAHYYGRADVTPIDVSFTWLEIFAAIGPSLVKYPSDARVKRILAEALYRKCTNSLELPPRISIAYEDFETIRIQLETNGLIAFDYNDTALVWYPTERGKREIIKLRTIPPSTE